jgi:hypothetical protein
MAKKHASEFGKHKIQWLLKNSFIRESRAVARIEGLTEALTLLKDYDGFEMARTREAIESKITSIEENN